MPSIDVLNAFAAIRFANGPISPLMRRSVSVRLADRGDVQHVARAVLLVDLVEAQIERPIETRTDEHDVRAGQRDLFDDERQIREPRRTGLARRHVEPPVVVAVGVAFEQQIETIDVGSC